MTAEIGKEAPDFELRATTGESIKLSQYRGEKSVALVFVPFAFTGVCTGEFCALQEDLSAFEAEGVQVLGISCDPAPSQKKWAEQDGYSFPLLSDFWPHGAVAQAYGVFNDTLGCANRGTFVINKEGVIVDAFFTDSLGTAREKSSYEAALTKL